MTDNKKHTFVIHARPAGVPLALQNLPADIAVRVSSNICGVQTEGAEAAEKVLRELKSTIDRQSEGFYTINEAAQIWADAIGTDPKMQRKKLWKEIERGRLTAFDEADKFETLEFSKVKYSCLVREADLIEIGVFLKMPAKAPAQDTATPAPGVAASETPDPVRRLNMLRAFGGTVKYKDCDWTFTGIKKLVQSEKKAGHKRSDVKTIRKDLKEAAQAERDAKKAEPFDRMGQR